MPYLPVLYALSDVKPFWLTSHLTDKPRIYISLHRQVLSQSGGEETGLEKKKTNLKMKINRELKDKRQSFSNSVYFIFITFEKAMNKWLCHVWKYSVCAYTFKNNFLYKYKTLEALTNGKTSVNTDSLGHYEINKNAKKDNVQSHIITHVNTLSHWVASPAGLTSLSVHTYMHARCVCVFDSRRCLSVSAPSTWLPVLV